MPSAASAISGEWAATDTGSSMARLAPSSFAIASDASTAGRSPETTTWPGEFRFATPKTPWADGSLDQLRQPGVVEADDRGHPALATGAGRLHALAAGPRRGGRRRARSSAPAATSAVYWPIEWPAAKAGAGTSTPSSAHRPRTASR